MALTIELWEDYGAPTGSPLAGTTREEVASISWKSADLDESNSFVNYPVNRPYDGNLFTTSYTKYNYFKIQGTYDDAYNLAINFENDPAGNGGGSGVASNVKILYNWTNTYAASTTNLLAGSTYNPDSPQIWRPLLSTQGPEYPGTSVHDMTGDATFYTPYLVTQLIVYPGGWDDFGNISEDFTLNCTFNENKAGFPTYDATLVNWSW